MTHAGVRAYEFFSANKGGALEVLTISTSTRDWLSLLVVSLAMLPYVVVGCQAGRMIDVVVGTGTPQTV